jgi:hypothetical protein
MHYYERNIADIKTEYTDFLIHILSPLIYEGLKSMYDKSIEQETKYIQLSKENVNLKNPGVFKIFQHFLKNIPTLNQNLIESELIRIRDSSKHADIFEKLIKAVIKSNIILLTYNASGKQCKLVNEKIHEKIDCKMFIHKIYIESARQFYNTPELFWHLLPPLEVKRNQRDCINIINKSIIVAIKESIPMNDILSEYLKNDYIIETEQEKINRLKSMINNNVEDNINFFDEDEKKVLLSEQHENKILLTAEENNLDENVQNDINDIEKLIGDNQQNNEQNNQLIQSATSVNEEEYKQKLNNFNNQPFRSNQRQSNQRQSNQRQSNQKQQPQPQPQAQQNQNLDELNMQGQNQDNQDNINSRSDDIENINIVKNKLDDRSYFNALFN